MKGVQVYEGDGVDRRADLGWLRLARGVTRELRKDPDYSAAATCHIQLRSMIAGDKQEVWALRTLISNLTILIRNGKGTGEWRLSHDDLCFLSHAQRIAAERMTYG